MLTRTAGLTWGLTFNKIRLLFNTTIWAAISHGAPIWALGDTGQGLPASTLKPLQTLQKKCARLVAGVYKRTLIATLKKEIDIPPLPIYFQALALNHAENTRNSDAEELIQARCATIKHRLCTGTPQEREIQETPQESLRKMLLREKQQQPRDNQV